MLAIDPGVHTIGWARFSAYRLTACGLERGDSMLALLRGFRVDDVTTLVVEIPQVYSRGRGDPNDLVDIALVAGAVIGRLCWADDVVLVRPAQWKGQRPKGVDNALTLSCLDDDERAIVDGVDCPRSLRHNVIDAVGIGLWQLRRR